MKKFIFSFAVILFLTACGSSPLEKAEALIKEDLPKNLIKPDSYDPIETEIDSAFAPLDDPMLYSEMEKIVEISKQTEEIQYQMSMIKSMIKSERSTMSIHSDNLMSAYSRNAYNEARSNLKEYEAKQDYYLKSLKAVALQSKEIIEKINKMLKSEPVFIGYRATHRYRMSTNDDKTVISEDCYILDKDVKEVLLAIPLEEYNSVVNSAEMIRQQSDIAIQALQVLEE